MFFSTLVSIWWVLRGRMIINVPLGLHDVAILGCETCPIPMPQFIHGSWNGWKWVGIREIGWSCGKYKYSDPYVPKYYLEPLLVYNYLKWTLL